MNCGEVAVVTSDLGNYSVVMVPVVDFVMTNDETVDLGVEFLVD